jgi:hypothetical protein
MPIFVPKVCRICMTNNELVPIVGNNLEEGALTVLQKLEALNLNVSITIVFLTYLFND